MKKLCIWLLVVALTVASLGYVLFINRIDTKYAVNFSEVFSTYDMDKINYYLADETVIICNNKRTKYAELRGNVENACSEKKYRFDNSYGHENNRLENNVREIRVYLYGTLDGKNIGEANVLMRLRKIGLFKFEIVSLECNEPVFEYIFYGNKQ